MFTLILASAEAPKEGISLILPHWWEVLWGTLMFLVLFVALWKFAFPLVKKALDNRARTIESDLKRAEEAKLEAEDLLEDYRRQLAGASEEVARIIEEGRRTADELRKDLIAKAQEDAKEVIAAGRRDVEGAVGSARAQLRRQMADISVDLAGRIIGRELDLAGQQQIIDEFIAELDAMGATAAEASK